MFNFHDRFLCGVAIVFLLCQANANGQCHDFGSVAKIQTAKGIGTCFAVATSDSEVEVWTAAHVCDGVGSTAIVTWETGEQTNGVVAWEDDRGDRDAAKIVCTKPTHSISPLDVWGSLHSNDRWHYHSGYGNLSRQESRAIVEFATDDEERRSFYPAPIPGDSGGPVQDRKGKVVAVTVILAKQGRRSWLVARPISDWLPK